MEAAIKGPLGRAVITFALLTTDISINAAKGVHKMEKSPVLHHAILSKESCSQSLKGFHSFPFLSGKHGTFLPLYQFLNHFQFLCFLKAIRVNKHSPDLLFYQFLLYKYPVIQAKQVLHLKMSSFRFWLLKSGPYLFPWAYIPLAFVMVSMGFFFFPAEWDFVWVEGVP